MLGISLRHLGFSNFVSEKIYIYFCFQIQWNFFSSTFVFGLNLFIVVTVILMWEMLLLNLWEGLHRFFWQKHLSVTREV